MKLGIFTGLLTLASTALGAYIELNDDSFEEIVLKSGKPAFVKFYASWCFHCKEMQPQWEELSAAYDSSDDINIVAIDADKYKSVRQRYGISSFPDIKLFKPDSLSEPINYSGKRDFFHWNEFLSENLDGVKSAAVKKPSMMVQLHDGNLENFIQVKGRSALALFTTEKECELCDEYIELFDILANTYHKDLDKILISEVRRNGFDPTDWTRNLYGVEEYPKIVFIENGDVENFEFYEGELDPQALVEYVNHKVKLRRAIDGTMDKNAGLIPELIESLADFIGHNVCDRREMMSDFVAKMRAIDPIAWKEELKYYAIVFNQINSNNANFFDTEKEKYEKLITNKSVDNDQKDSASMKLNFLRWCEKHFTENTWMAAEDCLALQKEDEYVEKFDKEPTENQEPVSIKDEL